MAKKITALLSIITLIIAFLIFLTSCAPTINKTTSSLSSEKATPQVIDPEITALLNKNKEVTNYNYLYDAEKTEGYAVNRVGNKIKKVYTEPLKMGSKLFFNSFYLDLEKKTVFGVCDKLGVTCTEQWNKAYPLDFFSQEIADSPQDLAQRVPATAKIVGGENVESRSTEIIEYINADEKLERLSLDKFYGLPLKQVIYSSADSKSAIVVKHLYTRLAVGQLKESDVALPEGIKIMS